MQLVRMEHKTCILTGNPQITFFKVVYRRHTNFSMECIEQDICHWFTDFGRKCSVTVLRNGDLAYHLYLRVAQMQLLLLVMLGNSHGFVVLDMN